MSGLRAGLRAGWAERRKASVAVSLTLFVGFLLWGPGGRVPLLEPLLRSVDPVVGWMIRFSVGAALMVVLPLLVIRFWQDGPRELERWGLGLGRWQVGLPLALVLGVVLGAGTYVLAPGDPALADEYPLYGDAQPAMGLFIAYEAAYLLFFMANELAMRGILLFGLRDWTKSGAAAVILAAIVQLVWHLHKPAAEMWMAGFWGLGVGALALTLRSAWWGVLFHWMSNVALDVALRGAVASVPPG
jgi:hypothetical protein